MASRARAVAILLLACLAPVSARAATDTDQDGIPDAVEPTVGRDPATKDNDVCKVARLLVMQQYRDFLDREGDTGGIDFWVLRLGQGTATRQSLIDNYFRSAEFQSTTAPVTRLYWAYFLRIPDYGGLTYWV